ncbi:hypothetical protein DA100_20885 [Vibrio sp. Hep-1b-8]|nr:hypothetical protein DA100_20885 [Vibrio sp. Hep-1b-8]
MAAIFVVFTTLFAFVYCLFSPRNPIDTSGYTINDARTLADHCHALMAEKIAQLDLEVAQLELQAGAKPRSSVG